MIKPTPNPPTSSSIFTVNPHQNTETLLVNASETLASLNALACGLAFELNGAQRGVLLAIQQMTELGQLLVERALAQLSPAAAA
ncbi:hypothetical protein HBO12_11320 [Pseudomonas sp. WS 5059]|uniref:DUF6124 family protein n=1 Tax=Pseudomonas sp. WS 5059 TaxID=2717491 RepID=UPI001473A3D2|nr:DUF6124 family protein [Pseudomonas sp. WS 5059]NMY03542.1 hypothetical protein [Pseudomonas sp. WS 5059]